MSQPVSIKTLCQQPIIMGVLNLTPDSMYDGGWYNTIDKALPRVETMIAEGADIIDIGGESTKPGAQPVSVQQELDRLLPIIEAIKQITDIPLSIDTSQPKVMQVVVAAGISLINDVRALQLPGALTTAAQLKVPVCLMHMVYPFGMSASVSSHPLSENIIEDIKQFFTQRIRACENAGIAREQIILDPGFGAGIFGKTTQQNLHLLAHLNEFKTLDLPLLVGLSHKTFVSEVLNTDIHGRLFGSLASATLAIERGADIIRVHDVKATKDCLKLTRAVQKAV